MHKNAFDTLKERGFIEQCTHEEPLRALLAKERVTFYMGYDPTADSLTVGHYLTLMAMAHMQRAGHRPIVLVGGGTGMVGDPTDKTEMRRVMPREEVEHNTACIKQQIGRFIRFDDDAALMVDNAEWLLALEYVPFIREYGVHFSVNRMLSAEAYKARLDSGLTFFEFNYMLMQSYDFLTLFRRYGCRLQLGGDDQWSNIIAGTELIRKTESAEAYGLTLTLLTTGDGRKMGKTAGGAVWLDAERTPPYNFYQYWRNTDDSVVLRDMALLTFLPMEEIDAMRGWQGAELNKAKEILAYEVTKIVHGVEAADKARVTAQALFTGGKNPADAARSGEQGDVDAMPSTTLTAAELGEGIGIIALLEKTGLIASRSEGRRLVEQGGVIVNGVKISTFEHRVMADDFRDGVLLLQKGKKVYHRVRLNG